MPKSFEPAEPPVDVDPASQPNRDPITGVHGAHPVGVGVGAATAGVVGGVIGSAIPIVGTAVGIAVGTAVGAVIGGYAGKGAAETLFPTDEADFWRLRHRDRPYYDDASGLDFEQDYLAAYRFGYVSAYAYPSETFDAVEAKLRQAWTESNDASRLDWANAREAARDAWDRSRQKQAAADGERRDVPPMS